MLKKTIYSAIALFAIISQPLAAQALLPTSWDLIGNAGTNTSTNFVGTTDQVGLVFRTSNAKRMFISSSGNIGIGNGTSTPNAKLDVFGTVRINNNKLYLRGGTDQFHYLGWDLSVNGPTLNGFSGGSLGGTNVSATKVLTWTWDGANGKVGIGTASPASKLHVSGKEKSTHGKNAAIEISNTEAGGTNWYLRSGAAGTATPTKGFSIGDDNAYRLVIDSLGNIGVGTMTPNRPLEIQGSNEYSCLKVVNNFNGTTTANAAAIEVNSTAYQYGIGVEAIGHLAGISGEGNGNGTGTSTTGVQGYLTGTRLYGYAVKGSVASPSGANYAIYGTAPIQPFQYAAYFAGDIGGTGTFSYTSDIKLKKNIQPLNSVLSKLLQINPSVYDFRTDEYKPMNLAVGKQYGVIAQEVEKVFPELVRNDIFPAQYDNESNQKTFDQVDYKSVNYNGFIPLLIQSIKEQQKQIETLKSELDETKALLQQLPQNISREKLVHQYIENKPSLEQSSPNPFSEKTNIEFYVPLSAQTALIKIISIEGKEIQTIKLNQLGEGHVSIEGNSLSAGTYSYQLIIDGKTIDSKLMTLTK